MKKRQYPISMEIRFACPERIKKDHATVSTTITATTTSHITSVNIKLKRSSQTELAFHIALLSFYSNNLFCILISWAACHGVPRNHFRSQWLELPHCACKNNIELTGNDWNRRANNHFESNSVASRLKTVKRAKGKKTFFSGMKNQVAFGFKEIYMCKWHGAQ